MRFRMFDFKEEQTQKISLDEKAVGKVCAETKLSPPGTVWLYIL